MYHNSKNAFTEKWGIFTCENVHTLDYDRRQTKSIKEQEFLAATFNCT